MSDIEILATAEIIITIDSESLEDKGWFDFFHHDVDLNDYKDEFTLRVN